MNDKLKIESVKIRWDDDTAPDLSLIGEYTADYGHTYIVATGEHAGEIAGNVPDAELPERGRQFRYFIPYAGGEKPTTDKRTRYAKYARQDFNRMQSYNRGDWGMAGCFVECVVSHPETGTVPECRRLETLTSSGLWGIESDSDESYKREIESEQFADLAKHLEAFGIETTPEKLRAIASGEESE